MFTSVLFGEGYIGPKIPCSVGTNAADKCPDIFIKKHPAVWRTNVEVASQTSGLGLLASWHESELKYMWCEGDVKCFVLI